MISMPCPHCEEPVEFATEAVGNSVPCPKCRVPVSVPRPREVKYTPREPENSPRSQRSHRPVRTPYPARDDRPFERPVPSAASAPGVLLIVGGSVAGAALVIAGIIVQANAASMTWISSVGGSSIHEAFFQASGGVWKGVGLALQGVGVFCFFVGLALGIAANRIDRTVRTG